MGSKDEKEERSEKKHVYPWPTAEQAKKEYRSKHVLHLVKEKNATLAEITTSPYYQHGDSMMVDLQADVPILATTEGVYIGKKDVKPGEPPHAKFERLDLNDQNIVLFSHNGRANIHYAPILDQALRRDYDATYKRRLIFSGKEAHVTDDTTLPRSYRVASGQTLILSMPLPSTMLSKAKDANGNSKPVPMTPEGAVIKGEYYPIRPSLITGTNAPEANLVLLPDGTEVMMQPGARLKLSYRHGEKEIEVLDFSAKGTEQFAQQEWTKKEIAELPAQIAPLLEPERAAAKKMREAEEFYRDPYKGVNLNDPIAVKTIEEKAKTSKQAAVAAIEEWGKFANPLRVLQDRLSEAKNAPYIPTGALAERFTHASQLLREEVERQQQAHSSTAKTHQHIFDETLRKLSDGSLRQEVRLEPKQLDSFAIHQQSNEDGMHITRHAADIRLGTTRDGATYVSPFSRDTVIGISGQRLITQEDQVTKLNMRAALKQDGFAQSGEKPRPEGTEITGGTVVIDNMNPVTLRIPGERENRDIPLHIVARGALTVDFSKGTADRYAKEPMSIRTVKDSDITVKVEKDWEFKMFGQRSALNQTPGYLEGMMADKEGKVTGFQAYKDGPVVHLRPKQKLTIAVGTMEGREVESIFNTKEVLGHYPAYRFTVTGGSDITKTLEELKQQYRTQQETKPRESQEIPPDAINQPRKEIPAIQANLPRQPSQFSRS